MDKSISDDARSPQLAPALRIPWSWLSMGLTAVAAGALGTLAVIVSVKDVDTLSTVALALAVVAFVAQLIVSLAQGMAGAQQLAQAEQVYTRMHATLSGIRAETRAILTNQRDHVSVLLRAALPQVVEQSVADTAAVSESGTPDQDALRDTLLSRFDELLSDLDRPPFGSGLWLGAVAGSHGGWSSALGIFGSAARRARRSAGLDLTEVAQRMTGEVRLDAVEILNIEAGEYRPIDRPAVVALDAATNANGLLIAHYDRLRGSIEAENRPVQKSTGDYL